MRTRSAGFRRVCGGGDNGLGLGTVAGVPLPGHRSTRLDTGSVADHRPDLKPPAAVTSMDKLPAVHLTRRDSRHLLIEAETSPFDSGCCPSDMPRGSGRLGVVTGPVSDGGHRLLLAESGPGSEHLTELVVPQLLADLGY